MANRRTIKLEWSRSKVEPEGEFNLEPLHILDKREVQLRKRIVVQLKVSWKKFEVDEATMRKAYPALFHDIIQSP